MCVEGWRHISEGLGMGVERQISRGADGILFCLVSLSISKKVLTFSWYYSFNK